MKTIAELKKMVIGPSDMGATFHYFFDMIDSNQIRDTHKTFTKHDIKQSRELGALILSMESILTNFSNKKIKISKPLLFYIPTEHFFHGSCDIHMESQPITVLYFSDIKSGVFCTAGINEQTEYFRIALAPATHDKQKAH